MDFCGRTTDLFPAFKADVVTTSGADIFYRTGGSGPPLLLLHGFPQTHAMWHRVAVQLAHRFTLVLPDLRGYGKSSKPPAGNNHSGYSKRAMAIDMVEVMSHLGFKEFYVAGHDRGGRVAHRMALDHPEQVQKIAVLDIIPTIHRFENIDLGIATKAYHWFFLIQPGNLPEILIGASCEHFLRHTLNSWALSPNFWDERAFASYLASLSDAASLHAICEDYRASASIDLEHDKIDADRKITQDLLVISAKSSPQGSMFNAMQVWTEYAEHVRGIDILSGHFLAEEASRETAAALLDFFLEAKGAADKMYLVSERT